MSTQITGDANKENVANREDVKKTRNVSKSPNSENMNSRILQKLNKVLKEEGLNLNVSDFLRATADDVNAIENSTSGSRNDDMEISVNISSDEAYSCCDHMMNVICNRVMDEVHKKQSEESKKQVTEPKVLSTDAIDQFNIESKISVNCEESAGKGNSSVTDAIKEEREDVIIMEEIDLEEAFQISEVEMQKESPSDAKENKMSVDENVQETKAANDSQKVSNKSDASQKKNDSGETKHIWVTNMDRTTRAIDLQKMFSKYGKVVGAKIVTDGSRCYGYISVASKEDADKCIKKLNNREVKGKRIIVRENKPERLQQTSSSSKKRIVKKAEKAAISSDSVRCKEVSAASAVVAAAAAAPKRRVEYAGSAQEKRLKESLLSRKRQLDEDTRTLNEQRMRHRKREAEMHEARRILEEDKEKLRLNRELLEKEKAKCMSAERELRRERDKFEKDKYEFERVKEEFKRLKVDVEKKMSSEIFKNLRHLTTAAATGGGPKQAARRSARLEPPPRKKHSFAHCSGGGDAAKPSYRSAEPKSNEYSRSKSGHFERLSFGKVSKSMDCGHCHSSAKEEKLCSFGGCGGSGGGVSRSSKRAASPSYAPSCEAPWKQSLSGGGDAADISKSYQHGSKGGGWGVEHTWRSPAASSTPLLKMGWNGGGGGGGSSSGGRLGGGVGSGYGASSFSSSRGGLSSNDIVCPPPPGVSYGGNKYEGSTYSHCRKY